MNKKLFIAIIGTAFLLTGLIAGPSNDAYSQDTGKKVLRLGYFPNINHAQAVIGVGNGDFQFSESIRT